MPQENNFAELLAAERKRASPKLDAAQDGGTSFGSLMMLVKDG
jgi:hypothetical protein